MFCIFETKAPEFERWSFSLIFLYLRMYMGECKLVQCVKCWVVRDSYAPWQWEIWQVKPEQIMCREQLGHIFKECEMYWSYFMEALNVKQWEYLLHS